MAQKQHNSGKEEKISLVSSSNLDDFYQRAGKICFFFQVNDDKQFKRIIEWVESENVNKHGVAIILYGSVNRSVQLPERIVLFSKNDFSFWGKKKERLKQWIKTHDFNLLISFEPILNKKGMKIVKSVQSKIKVGSGKLGQAEFYQLNIEYSKSMDYTGFFEWIKKYFLELNIKL